MGKIKYIMKILKITIYIGLFLFSQWSYCVSLGHPKTDEDFALLPPYCKVQMHAGYEGNIDPTVVKIWEKRLGAGYYTSHHYCWGLHYVNLAHTAVDKAERNRALNAAINDMRYPLQYAPPEFILLPKISYDIGQILEELGDDVGAMQAYYQSIKLNPKLPRPYAAISDLYKKQNNTKEALAILEQGLKYKPKSKALLKRLAQLSKEK